MEKYTFLIDVRLQGIPKTKVRFPGAILLLNWNYFYIIEVCKKLNINA